MSVLKIAGLDIKQPDPLPEYNVFLIDAVAGVGKTTLATTVGKGNKVLILDFEGGTSSLSNPLYPTFEDAADVEDIHILSFPREGAGAITNVNKLVQTIESVFDALIASKNAEGYSLIALDSVTELQQRFLDLHAASDPRQSYGAWAQAIYGVVHKMRATPINSFISSRPTLSTDEVSGVETVRSSLSPAAWKLVSGLVDANGLLTRTTTLAGRVTRTLDFTSNQRYQAKTRLALGKIENPTFKKLLDLIEAGGKGESESEAPVRPPVKMPNFPRKGATK